MSPDILLVFSLLLGTIVLFVVDRLRMDVVAILLIIALVLTGLLGPEQAFAGFGDPLVILIAALFVVGEGLFRTGVAFSVGQWLMRVAGTSRTRLMIFLMLVVAFLSAFMSNTGAVAIFIPVAITLARRAGVPRSSLLLPMAYAGSIGGMLTLIGTPPNLVVSTELSRIGLEPFRFFSFLPIGLLILAAVVLFVRIFGPRLLKARVDEKDGAGARMSLSDLVRAYDLEGRFHLCRVEGASPLVNSTIGDSKLRSLFGVMVIALERSSGSRRVFVPVGVGTRLQEEDLLFLSGSGVQVRSLLDADSGLRRVPLEQRRTESVRHAVGMAEVLVAPRSRLVGRTIRKVSFREDHGLSVLSVMRRGRPLQDDFLDVPLEVGDSLLVVGGWRQVQRMQLKSKDLIVLTLPQEMDEVAPNRERAPWALGIVGAMLIVMTFGVLPAVSAVMIAALGMVLARCVSMEEAYSSVNWQSVVLIAGMLPMATALEDTGALSLIVSSMVGFLGDAGPRAVMAGLFLLTAVFSQFISNSATAVLVAPIAVGVAGGLGVSPYPLLMTVAVGASTAFSTPMASPVNTLIIGPGGYGFRDFLKMGVPLQLIALVITLVVVPLLFPFQ